MPLFLSKPQKIISSLYKMIIRILIIRFLSPQRGLQEIECKYAKIHNLSVPFSACTAKIVVCNSATVYSKSSLRNRSEIAFESKHTRGTKKKHLDAKGKLERAPAQAKRATPSTLNHTQLVPRG